MNIENSKLAEDKLFDVALLRGREIYIDLKMLQFGTVLGELPQASSRSRVPIGYWLYLHDQKIRPRLCQEIEVLIFYLNIWPGQLEHLESIACGEREEG